MLRDLLVHVSRAEQSRSRVQFAVELAICTGARLSGIYVTPPIEVPPVYKPSMVEEVAADLSSKSILNAQMTAAMFREETIPRLDNACWFEADGDIVKNISNRARYADLVILGQHEWQGSAERHPLSIAQLVVMHSGRPILVVPHGVQSSSLATIAVAWDGSRESVRALHDALPLLRLAESVQILMMGASSAQDSELDAKYLSEHLAQHEIVSRTDVIQIRTSKKHDSLRRQIDRDRYDLLVMGGYSHPMWLEFIFGGVTQSILATSNIPVLVSH